MWTHYHYIPLFLTRKLCYTFYSLCMLNLQIWNLDTWSMLAFFVGFCQDTMGVLYNNNHIIFYHIDALQAVGLAWTYFTYPDYLVVQCWVYVTYLSPDTINQMGPHTYHYVKFLEGLVGYTPLGAPFNCIMAIIDKTNAAMPFVVITNPALWTAPTNHRPLYHNMSGVNLASMN